MSSQLDRQLSLFSESIESLGEWKKLVTKYFDGDEKDQEMQSFEEVVKGFCEADFEIKKGLKALESVAAYYSNDSNDDTKDVEDVYKSIIAENTDEMPDHTENIIWKQLVTGTHAGEDVVEEVVQEKEEQAAASEYQEVDDSISYLNVFTPPQDPITKLPITVPYKSRNCGHIYEEKYIRQFIKTMKGKAKCPVVGCNNKNLTMGELVRDSETQEKIDNYKKSKAGQSQEEEEVEDTSDDEDD